MGYTSLYRWPRFRGLARRSDLMIYRLPDSDEILYNTVLF